jgi:hypothetical protein
MTVRILHAGIEHDAEFGTIIRGVIDPETFKYIHFAWYQRERGFSKKHIDEIVSALFMGSTIEDLTLGMRGARVQAKGNTYTLVDKVFCINGGQRLYAADWALKERPDTKIHLGAKILLNTNERSENELFCKAGTTQVRISASVLLRNRKKDSPVVELLIAMNDHEDFALKARIAWDQQKNAHELMTGFTFARIIGALHAHKGAALKNSKVYELLHGLDDLYALIGHENLQRNIIRFFDTIDSCWSIRQLSDSRRDQGPHMRQMFLLTIARLFSRYPDFWDGKARAEFYFPNKFLRALRGFKLSAYLARPEAVDSEILFERLRKQLNLQPIIDDEAAEAAE